MQLTTELSPAVLQHLETLERESHLYEGLQCALAEAAATLEPVPDSGRVQLIARLTPQALGSDYFVGIATLFSNVEARLHVLFLVNCYRLLDLLDTIIHGLNCGRLAATVLAARSMVEHSAIGQWRQRELSPLLEELAAVRPSTIRKSKGDAKRIASVLDPIVKVIEKLEIMYGAGRFNRDALMDLSNLKPIEIDRDDRHRQIGVMDAIDDVCWTGPMLDATTPRFYYELLCDYVHPNVGSNFLYVNQESTTEIFEPVAGARNAVLEMELASNVSDASLYLHVFQLITIPLRESINSMIEHIQWLGAQRAARREFVGKLRELNIRGLLRPS